ncbi:MAG TPA: hypothetical protein VEH57_02525 [Thermoplasmata archaeon]|nr:hypothetical protein [Thermoplasmata archaeon]
MLSEGTRDLEDRAAAEVRGFEIFFYEFLPRHHRLWRIITQAEYANPGLFEWHYRRIAQGYSRRLRAAMQSGEYRRWDWELAAFTLMGIAHFVAMRYISWDEGLSRVQFRQLTDFMLRGLVRRPTASRQGRPRSKPRRPPSRKRRSAH